MKKIPGIVLLIVLFSFLTASRSAASTEKEKIIKNPDLIERYLPRNELQFDFGEHLMINVLVGAFTGVIFGGVGGLSTFQGRTTAEITSENPTSDFEKNKTAIISFAAIGGLVGLTAGGLFTWYEYTKKEQFTHGRRFMNFTWYGGMGGAMIGALGGLAAFASSNEESDILQGTGMGSLAGVAFSWALYFFYTPSAETNKIQIDGFFDPELNSFNVSLRKRF